MIHAQMLGKGRGRLFLHGINADSHCWDTFLHLCGSGWRNVAVDLPGHGRSSPLPSGHHFEDYADILATWLDEICGRGEPRTWQVIGHSLGGMIAVDLADRYAHKVENLVLIAPAGFDHPWYHRDLSRIPAGQWFRRLLFLLLSCKPIGSRLFEGAVHEIRKLSPADIRRLQQGFRRARSVLQIREFYRYPGFLEALQSWVKSGGRVDFIWGRNDRVVPYADAQLLKEFLPASRLITLERCGHLPMVEHPELLCRALRELDQL